MIKIFKLSCVYIFLVLLSVGCKKSDTTVEPDPIDSTGTPFDTYIEEAKYLYARNVNADPSHPDYNKSALNNTEINKIFGYFKAVKALNSPQTDSLFNYYKIKIYHKIKLSSVTFAPRPSTPGIDNLINGKIPTGNKSLDKFLAEHGFDKASVYNLKELNLTLITLKSRKELNTLVVERKLRERSEVLFTESPQSMIGDGHRIGLTYRGDTAILSFFRGGGDCPAGCSFAPAWVFEINNGVAVYKGRSVSLPPSP